MSLPNLQTQNKLDALAQTFLKRAEQRRSSVKRKTRAKARVIFNAYCKALRKRDTDSDANVVLPVKPETIIREILRANYVEMESIPSEPFEELKTGKSLTEIAGLIDRKNLRIVIAKKFEPEWKRFTAAHEIGHWVLHKNVIYLRERPIRILSIDEVDQGALPFHSIRLRERPITGHELEHSKRPPEESDADTFAAELLMPPEYLVKSFFYRFGGPIRGRDATEHLAFWLSLGRKSKFTAQEFAKWPRRMRSRHIAKVTSFSGSFFRSLAEQFGVSTTPMAIQLEDLGLVT